MKKTHVSLNVRNLEDTVTFYSRLFDTAPAKRRPGYANFDLDNPPLKLALNETASNHGLSHLGIQVPDTAAVHLSADRFRALDIAHQEEHATYCCHAMQDKVWVRDPDGHPWEVFTVRDDEEPTVS